MTIIINHFLRSHGRDSSQEEEDTSMKTPGLEECMVYGVCRLVLPAWSWLRLVLLWSSSLAGFLVGKARDLTATMTKAQWLNRHSFLSKRKKEDSGNKTRTPDQRQDEAEISKPRKGYITSTPDKSSHRRSQWSIRCTLKIGISPSKKPAQ